MQDNATPSGNSLAVTALLRLGRLTGRTDFEAAAEDTLRCLVPLAQQYPSAAGQLLQAVDFQLGPSYEIAVISSATSAPATSPHTWQIELATEFRPHLLWIAHSGTVPADSPLQTILHGKSAVGAQPTAYACDHGICREPVTSLVELRQILDA